MIPIEPFRALRPSAARAREFSIPRLDHLGEIRRAAIEARLPLSAAAVLGAGGPALLAELEQAKALLRHPEPTFYMHRHVKGPQRCVGLVACVHAQAFGDGRVRPHRDGCGKRAGAWREQVDRLGVQVDPVVLAFEMTEVVHDLFERETNERPLYHVVADDGATHTLWSGTRAPALQQAFATVTHAYLLEGHHRVQAARGGPISALLVPVHQVVARWSARTLAGEAGARVAAWVAANGRAQAEPDAPADGFAHAFVRTADTASWWCVPLPAVQGDSPVSATADARLDTLLRHCVGEPGLRVPGAAAPQHVEELVAESGAGVGFLLPSPAFGEIARVADAGARLPMASTWFEPRIRSGLWMA